VEIRHVGKVPAGVCHFDEEKYQKKKARRRGTRAGSISIYCAHEALADSKLDWESTDKDRVGVYLGITEHGNVETEHEIHDLYNQNNKDVNLWSHHHNPRTVANNPAGEACLNLGITGPHYTVGAACAAGNAGIIQGLQMLRLGEIDVALAGGVSECTETFGIFAAFKSQGALGDHENPHLTCRPLDKNRNGIAVSEGGAIFVLERLEDALARGAKIYGEVAGYHINTDATDFVLPNAQRQAQCMQKALDKANMKAEDVDLLSMHATGTGAGDIIEIESVRAVFGHSKRTLVNGAKAVIGHAMGASGALELAGNLPSFTDSLVHPFYCVEEIDPLCAMEQLVINKPVHHEVKVILNNSFGMLGINSALIIKKFDNRSQLSAFGSQFED
jgi:3-oxoacyl-[acyl-carrier-protein] synthase II